MILLTQQSACTGTTSRLYPHEKPLVPARKDACSVTTKLLVASLQMVFTYTLTAKTRANEHHSKSHSPHL